MKLYQLMLITCTIALLSVAATPVIEQSVAEQEECKILKPQNITGVQTKDGRFKSNGTTRDIQTGSWLEDCYDQ